MEPPQSAASALAELTHTRWALPALAQVAADGGCKLVTLSKRLNASPASLKRALERLEALGLVIPNPGYGHPLRPEYILGPVGLKADRLPGLIVAWGERENRAAELYKKWQLPVLVALDAQPCRFNDVRRKLPSATSRAIAMALKSHSLCGLVSRVVDDGFPPVPRYAPAPAVEPCRAPAVRLGELLFESRVALIA